MSAYHTIIALFAKSEEIFPPPTKNTNLLTPPCKTQVGVIIGTNGQHTWAEGLNKRALHSIYGSTHIATTLVNLIQPRVV